MTAVPDLDGVNERVTLTHTATLLGMNVQTLRDATVRVFVEDPDEHKVWIQSLLGERGALH